jgi:Protein of unknown function (DUF2510)
VVLTFQQSTCVGSALMRQLAWGSCEERCADMGGLSPWHLVVLLVIFAIIVGIVVLIVRLAKPKSVNPHGVPGTPTAAAPGWYPDPNDSSLMRYFDGRVWTSSTQPRG